MFDRVNALREGLEEAIDRLDPDALDGPRALELFEELIAMERLVAAGKVLVTGRIDETRAWRSEGDRSHAHFVARKTGTSVHEAVRVVQTAQRVDRWGATAEALKAGDLSTQQASAITDAVAADPNAEPELLATAANDGLVGLRDECRRVKAAAVDDPIARHREIHRRRHAYGQPTADGAFRIQSSMTPEAGAVLWARVEADADQLARDVKAASAPVESRAAYCADALAALATGDVTTTKVRRVVTVTARVDAGPWVSGELRSGDICEIDGAGPVAPQVMWDFATDALIYGIVTNGTDLTHMSKLGGEIPAALRRAVLARDRECGVIGCHQRHNLEIDHVQPRAREGPHSMENLRAACQFHHALWTYYGWTTEGSHQEGWRLIPPTDRDPPDLQLAV